MSVMGVTGVNEEQKELERVILDNSHKIIIATGRAGTGKDFISIASALQLKSDKKYQNIFYVRDPIEVGESLGFLKGDEEEKFDPFLGPLLDTVTAICNNSNDNLNPNDLLYKIEGIPLNFVRGRTFEDAIVICDECQNMNFTELQTIITRVGKFSKIILLGSYSQIDKKEQLRKPKCDFQVAAEALVAKDYVSCVELKQSVRNDWCAEVDQIFDDLKRKTF
jgi:Predicted ATPase related to phosphate starvation-inducible protein PhoH